MKTIKQIIKLNLIIAAAAFLAVSCSDDENDTGFVIDSIDAPTNVNATVTISQDNTGTVTITPNATGAATFVVDFGDGSTPTERMAAGSSVEHVYPEGEFTGSITAYALNDLSTTIPLPIVVSFLAPQNLAVTFEVDALDPFLVRVNATADLETYFEFYPGESADEDPIQFMESDNPVEYTYSSEGDFTALVIAYSGGSATAEYSETVTISAPQLLPIEGVWKLAPEAGALGVGPAAGDTSWWSCDDACVTARSCFYDDLYVFNTDGTFRNLLGTDSWIEGWQGGGDNCGAPVAPHDGVATATYTYNSGAGTITLNGTGAYLGLPKANNQGELPNVAVPTSITYNVNIVDSNTIEVYIEAGGGVFWQYKLVRF